MNIIKIIFIITMCVEIAASILVTKNKILVNKNGLIASIEDSLQKRLYGHASLAINIFDGGSDEDLQIMTELKHTVDHTRFKD